MQTCDSIWKKFFHLHRHERSREATVKRVYPGGVYHSPQSIFQQLEEEGIYVDDERGIIRIEQRLILSAILTRHQQWLARHEVLSVSITSNIEGHTKREQREP